MSRRNCYEESFKCIQQCKSCLRGDLGGIKALSGVVTVLDRTQELLCKKLGDHFVRLCLNDMEEEGQSLEQQLTPVFYELLNLKWLLKTLELNRAKAEEQLKEVMGKRWRVRSITVSRYNPSSVCPFGKLMREFRCAPRLAPPQAAGLRHSACAQGVFCDVHAAAKNGFQLIRSLRAVNSVRLF